MSWKRDRSLNSARAADPDRQASSWPGRLWQAARLAAESCSIADLPPGVAEQIRVEQVDSLSTLIGVMSVMGLGTVGLIDYEFAPVVGRVTLALASLSVGACYCTLLVMTWRWGSGRSGPAIAHAERARQRFTRLIGLLGVAWGITFILLMRSARDDSRSLLYAVIIGLMSAGVLVAPASAAFAFWLPITAAGVVAITFVSDARDFAGTLLLVGYTSLTFFCIIYLNRALIRRVLGEIDQHEGRETIGLLLRDFEDYACDWLWETDRCGRLSHVSRRFAQAARTEPECLLGADFVDVLLSQGSSASRRIAPDAPQAPPAIAGLIAGRLPFRDVEVSLEVGAEAVTWSLTGKPKLAADGTFEGFRGVGSDVTLARRTRDRAQYLANYDELTGLPNRRLFREVLDAHFQFATTPDVALLCLDLDRFKVVNDAYGHLNGDALLVAVARRLEQQVRGGDFCARLGGDEFAVILFGTDPDLVSASAERLIADISRPYVVDGIKMEVGVSIGIAYARDDVPSSVAILRNADSALYEAKACGRGAPRLYDAELRARDARRRVLQGELRQAIEQDELHLDYQPIFDLQSGRVIAVEALIRWHREPHEILAASDFVPVAEGSGLIDLLGEWVLLRACTEASHLPAAIRIAVNVSPLQIHGRRLITHIRRVLASSGLEPSRLELELTETAFFDMSPETLGLLHEIQGLGVRINLDDFGVGHTSLGQLGRFPFGTLKIDRSFVQDLPTNPSARAIVRGLTSMATELRIATTAEGVETPEQLALIRSLGCDCAQGFLLARPMTLSQVLLLLGEDTGAEQAAAALSR